MRIKRTNKEDLFLLLSGNSITKFVAKRKKLSKEAPEDYGEFVVWFMEKNKGRINKYAYRRCIPNRYTTDDICSYIAETILRTLQRRKRVGNPIEEPKLYFSKLIDYYCVEFQRMHGFIYGLPKRPRSPEAEQEIGKHGFNYLEPTTEIGYVDCGVHDGDNESFSHYEMRGQEPEENSPTWNKLLNLARPDDQKLLECVYEQNMSVPEASRHLGIAISTAYQRANRGLKAISGHVAMNVNLDQANWKVFKEIDTEINND